MTEMSTRATNQATWRETYRRHGYFFHVAAILTIATGALLHIVRVFFGDDLMFEHMFNTTFDMVFLIPMTYAAITGFMIWNRVEFVNKQQKVLFRVALFYIAISVPVHIFFSMIYGDVRPYTEFFPMWFSYVLFLPYTVFIVLFSTLHYKQLDD